MPFLFYGQLKVRMVKDIKTKPRVLIFILVCKHPGDSSKVGNCGLLEQTPTCFNCHVPAQ